MNHREQQHWFKEFLNKYPQAIAYIGLGMVLVLIFVLQGINDQNEEETRCKSGVESRNVDRDQTQQFYLFATSLVPGPKEIEQMPPDQKRQTKAFLARAKAFREASFSAIKPSDLCAPYVDDDNVTPEDWEKKHPPLSLNEH